MPNVADVLKDEIARIARREIRAELKSLNKAVGSQRQLISGLRKQISQLQRSIASRGVAAAPRAEHTSVEPNTPALRWRPDGLATHRARLGISAAQMGKLIGCSALSVYKWESGQVRPRRAQLQAIASVRTLTKRQALAKLQQLDASAQSEAEQD